MRPLLLALLLVACGPTFYVEGEVEEVCKETEVFTVPGVPEALAQQQGADGGVDYESPFDLSDSMPGADLDKLTAEARLADVTVTLTSGVESFDFVREASFELVPPEGSGLPAARAFALTQQDAPATLGLALEDRDIDLRPYLGGGKGTIVTHLRGYLPAKTWSAKVRPCLRVKARYDVL